MMFQVPRLIFLLLISQCSLLKADILPGNDIIKQESESPSVEDSFRARSHFSHNQNNSNSEVVYYDGNLGYKSTCVSDAQKEDYIQGIGKNNTSYEDARLWLSNASCNISQYLECRQVDFKIIPSKLYNYTVPVLSCQCPDYDKLDRVNLNAFYNPLSKKCVVSVRAKCSGFVLPTASKRFNGTGINKHSDGRRQPLEMPCVEHARCNVVDFADHGGWAHPGDRVMANKCICLNGYIPNNHNGCMRLIDQKTVSPTLMGLFLMSLPFILFFGVMERENAFTQELVLDAADQVVLRRSFYDRHSTADDGNPKQV